MKNLKEKMKEAMKEAMKEGMTLKPKIQEVMNEGN